MKLNTLFRSARRPGTDTRLNILITQRALANFGGTEMVTAETARSLADRGHRVAVYCPKPGKIANLITPRGVPVCDRLDALPFRPDIIHGHHHLPLMAALAHFPTTPAIHVWHGARPWVEKLPRHGNIRAYVVTSSRMVPRAMAEYGIPAERLSVIGNAVDTARYSHQRTIGDRPRHALLYGQRGFYAQELAQLDRACADNDLTLDKIGGAYGNIRPRPEYFLPDYDIVFAIGRSALEALACGCAVLPIVPQLAGTRITAASLGDWAAGNFSPRYFTSAERFDSAWLRRECLAWDRADIAAVTAAVRRDFTLTQAIDRFEALYRQVLAGPRAQVQAQDIPRYLEWLANEADTIWSKGTTHEARTETAEAENAGLRADRHEAEARIRFLMQALLRDRGLSLPSPLPDPADSDGDPHRLIARSGLFDADWYLQTYPRAAKSGLDALTHYLSIGASDGHDPSPGFDSAAYMQANPHLRGLGMSPLEHFLRQAAALAPGPGG